MKAWCLNWGWFRTSAKEGRYVLDGYNGENKGPYEGKTKQEG